MGSNTLRHRLTGNLSLVAGVAAILLAFGGRGLPEGEERHIFEPALSLVRDGTPKFFPPGEPARKERVWGGQPIASSAVHLPGALLVELGAKLRPQARDDLTVMGSQLASAVLAGVLATQFFGLACLLGFSRTVAGIAAVFAVFTTSMAVLGRTPLSHVLHAVLFTGAFATAVAFVETPSLKGARNLSLWLATLLTVAFGFALSVPGVVAVATWYGLRGGLSAPRLGWALAWPLVLGLLVSGIDSWLRMNTLTAVFAQVWSVPMKQSALSGLWGIFFSPGKSLLLYNLPIVLGCFGVRSILRRGQSQLLWLGVVFVVPGMLYFAKHPYWSGGWGWGPRYLMYTVPVLLLPALYHAEDLADLVRQRRWRTLFLPGTVAVFFVGAGLVIQLLGSALAPENYLRISSAVRTQWLGQPNRSGAFVQTFAPSCSPCFEDDYITSYLPPFQPIEGHVWLAKHLWAGDSHDVAQLTGPWHRETILDLNIKAEYELARFDWWLLDHLKNPRSIVMGLLLFGGLLFFVAFSFRLGIRNTDSEERCSPS
jgi:hypothetical protein